MKKFLILYTSPTPAREEMGKASTEQGKAGTDAWVAWAKKAGNALVELGAPLADAGATRSKVTGFSILQGNSASEIEQIVKDNPHQKMPGAGLEIHEFIEVPGMSQDQNSKRELEYSKR
jgi:hypothetical protein